MGRAPTVVQLVRAAVRHFSRRNDHGVSRRVRLRRQVDGGHGKDHERGKGQGVGHDGGGHGGGGHGGGGHGIAVEHSVNRRRGHRFAIGLLSLY